MQKLFAIRVRNAIRDSIGDGIGIIEIAEHGSESQQDWIEMGKTLGYILVEGDSGEVEIQGRVDGGELPPR